MSIDFEKPYKTLLSQVYPPCKECGCGNIEIDMPVALDRMNYRDFFTFRCSIRKFFRSSMNFSIDSDLCYANKPEFCQDHSKKQFS